MDIVLEEGIIMIKTVKRIMDHEENLLELLQGSEEAFAAPIELASMKAAIARLKSASRGKSGWSRICYYDVISRNEIYLLLIYAKNQQEDITAEDKKDFKKLVNELRRNPR